MSNDAASEKTSEGFKPSGQKPNQKMSPHPNNGDIQTLDLVVRHLCKVFDLVFHERLTYDGVVKMLYARMQTLAQGSDAVLASITLAQPSVHTPPAPEQPTFRPGADEPLIPSAAQAEVEALEDLAKAAALPPGKASVAQVIQEAVVRRNGSPSPGVTVGPIPPHHDALYSILETFTRTTSFSGPAALDILKVCLELSAFLMEKNTAYGNSALEPLRILSTADPAELIRVRMDDKLSRLFRGQAAGEDVIKDLVGYWVLMRVAEKRAGK